MEQKQTKRSLLKIIGFPLLFIAIIVVLIIFWDPILEIFKNKEQLEEWVNSTGIPAPIMFILLQILQVVIFIIPGEVPQIAGGYLFGIAMGTLYSIVGIAIGSGINFILGRALGVPFIKSLFKDEQIKEFQELSGSSHAKGIIFLIFLIPGIPKDVVTYIAGISPIRFFSFLLISSLGRMPGIIGSAIMGDAAAAQNWTLLIIVASVATILFVAGYLLKDKIFKIMKDKAK